MTTNVQRQDAFQVFILREVLLAEGLQGDINMAKVAPWLGGLLAVPASEAVAAFVKSGPAAPVAGSIKKVTKDAIIAMFGSDNRLAAIRTARKWWQQIKPSGDKESTAHSCCRAALAYAVQGQYEKAEEWLADADTLVHDLARPNFIRGMMFGAQGRTDIAVTMLSKALQGRAKDVTKARIQEVLSFAEAEAQ
jgi:hypothetical protein